MSGVRNRIDNFHTHNIAHSNMPTLTEALVREALAPFGVEATPVITAAVIQYTELLLRWNRKISLTSITDPREILERHFGESMFAAGAVPITDGKLIDVGSGAGFPGLALKLAAPDLELILVEANMKKAAFLAEVVRELKLKQVKVVSKRAEELREDSAADFVTCRAVRIDKRLLAWVRGALREAGKCVLWLGAEDAEELRKVSGWRWKNAIRLPNSANRELLVGTPA